jgi:hypothetical protein
MAHPHAKSWTERTAALDYPESQNTTGQTTSNATPRRRVSDTPIEPKVVVARVVT